MRIKRFCQLLCLGLLPLFMVASGCSTTESLTRKVLPRSWANKILPGQPNLKKRVMVFPLVDQAGAGSEKTAQLSHDFYSFLKESPDLLLNEPPDGVFSSLAMKSPQFGVVTNSRLVDFAEGLGMNSLIIGVINPVEISIRQTGIWPFDSWRKIYGVSVAINVIDTTTRTLMLTHLELEEFKVDLDETEDLDEKAFIQQSSDEALPELIEELASVVKTKVREEPWTGRILAVENKTIMINAGKEIGLQAGGVFQVFEPGKSIRSASGIPIHLLEESIGEIKVTSVMEKHALAEPVSGGPFVAKQFVRFKP